MSDPVGTSSSEEETVGINIRMGLDQLVEESKGKLDDLEKYYQESKQLVSPVITKNQIIKIRKGLSKLHRCENQKQFEKLLLPLGYKKSTDGKHIKYTLSQESLLRIQGVIYYSEPFHARH